MADETPTLRLGPQGSDQDERWAHLMLGDLYVGIVIDATAECITALAAALDPATTATLFDQRDAAITERDQLRAEVEALKFAAEEADLDRIYVHRLLVAERDQLHAELKAALKAKRSIPSHPGCCRAAADSDGHAHDHAEWYRDAQQAEAEVERMRPVLEAAQAWRTYMGASETYDAFRDLVAAVDVYNQPPSPDGETEVK